jgi:hypothetical protein
MQWGTPLGDKFFEQLGLRKSILANVTQRFDNRTEKNSQTTQSLKIEKRNVIEKRHLLNLVGKYCKKILGKIEIFYYTSVHKDLLTQIRS